MLAAGVVSLEFAAAVSTLVAATLLPVIAEDVAGTSDLGLIVTGPGLGLFVALPIAGPFAARVGARAALTCGLIVHLVGTALAVLATDAWTFAAGRFLIGLGGGLLAVFGISLVIERFEPTLRARVVAASSAMWILPALVGPAATVWLESLVGWRWTLAAPVPIVLAGRMLVALAGGLRASCARTVVSSRALLVPAGVTMLVLAARDVDAWPVAALGAVVATAGLPAMMPPGTLAAHRGVPAAMAVMVLFSIGYVGAGTLVTILFTGVLHTDLGGAAVAATAAPLAWATVSLVADRVDAHRGWALRAVTRVRTGLGLAAGGTAALVAVAMTDGADAVAVGAWAAAGAGVGLAYPALYVACTARDDDAAGSAVELAAAVIAAEAFGGLLGPAIGGALTSAPGADVFGLFAAYVVFAGVLSAAAALSGRVVWPPDRANR